MRKKIITNLNLFFIISLVFSLGLFGCKNDDPEINKNDSETFELIGTWLMTSPAPQTMTFTQTDGSSDKGFKAKLISFNNSENWYIVQPTEGANGDEGKYNMTRYTLSSDGNDYTGISYSSEDTQIAAKASTTITYSGITMTKQ